MNKIQETLDQMAEAALLKMIEWHKPKPDYSLDDPTTQLRRGWSSNGLGTFKRFGR